ncbi:DUF2147 domain-containing protein [Allofrancisella guangzhouensis]|uniref:DUF2147 domain-containing protein n=1 Tax=Allofrancisella guangzhouensis TaxID=594679 RepID=A0A0A8EB30_9GAMM|nr:DUF2147 domain-containing protein [Allofrancisella guangzhouensis]AJC49381.1 hypothetical protein SD28_07005 [Allofrancisella guangzhouensis]MBK2026893.1 DUF2147 domain-containing protein [Allofrancisella guangzhouensis]MBK2044613.1 DUF2147 domain-containing protein [Allofrancisella guangzhouensis]MBK2045375.1 DUF2147 domain-containing protein [Allofrancisella guangzhouensis]
MKKFKQLSLIILASFSVNSIYAEGVKDISKDNLSPEGYWVQFDEDKDAGIGKVQGIVHSYFAKNNKYGDKGTLEMEIVVPIMDVVNNKIVPAPVHCDVCGKGNVNGFKYDYTNPSDNLMQGLVFAGNLEPQENTGGSDKSLEFDKGGVLNPNDGKTYNSKAQVQDNGETLFARAYKGNGWYAVGKNAHWKRITESQYEQVKQKCGLNKETGVYPYEDKTGKVTNQKLFEECYNYDFGVKKPV